MEGPQRGLHHCWRSCRKFWPDLAVKKTISCVLWLSGLWMKLKKPSITKKNIQAKIINVKEWNTSSQSRKLCSRPMNLNWSFKKLYLMQQQDSNTDVPHGQGIWTVNVGSFPDVFSGLEVNSLSLMFRIRISFLTSVLGYSEIMFKWEESHCGEKQREV